MNTYEMSMYTSALLEKHSVHVESNPAAFDAASTTNMKNVDRLSNKRFFEAKAGLDYQMPDKVSSVPYITGIEGDKLTMMTYEPGFKKFRAESWAFGKGSALNATRLQDFRGEISNINRSRFTKGLDLDNMVITNLKGEPLGRDNLKRTLRHGAILPLSSRKGVFMPNFGMSPNYFSIEYEGRFQKDAIDISFNSLTRNPVKKHFGVDIASMMSYDMGRSSTSYKAYYDGSIQSRPGRNPQEVVLGATPQSNLIMAADMQFAAWEKEGLIHPNDRIMDKSAGMHISTTIPELNFNNRPNASSYLNSVGLIMDMMGRHGDRYNSQDYLGVSGSYDEGRNNFRMDSATKRMEYRHPGAISNSAFLANQLSLVGKMTNDLVGFGKDLDNFPIAPNRNRNSGLIQLPGTPRYRRSSTSGPSAYSRSPLRALHENTPDSDVMRDWFNSFTDALGITDPAQKKFMLMINKTCLKSQSPSFHGARR